MNVPEHVDVVVVGSGFGGAVSAFRLADGGRSVVVLERGWPYPPGSFPRKPHEMSRAFWDPGEGMHGLFDLWSFGGFESIVASGLGGGSLIYANVLLRKDERWFVHEHPLPGGGYETWPVTRADLDPHYDAVETMLAPERYPFHAEPYASTPKTRAVHDAAARLGLDWELPPLGVRFAPEPGAAPEPAVRLTGDPGYPNLHRRPRQTCLLDGECDIGCNAGAKNSLDHTYLSAAKHAGAQIRTLCEVRVVRPRFGGGYVVDYVRHRPGDPGRRYTEHRITADRVVLGAGTFGTTRLLLRSRPALRGLGDAMGTRFCGNGDLLAFLTPGDRPTVFDASRGPVITSTIRVGDTVDGDDGRGFYLQDGGFPGFVHWIAEAGGAAQWGRMASFVADWLRRRLWETGDPQRGEEVARLVGDGSLSAGTLPLLGMGRDVPDGTVSLDADGRLAVDWTARTSQGYFDRVEATMAAISAELGTTLQENPLAFFRRVVTVHPLGGAPMGHRPETGVCDDRGQVFGHPGLYVADGAAMPGPVGPNPSLTIAAHADRLATGILEKRTPSPARGGPRRAPRRPTGLSFTEEMRGRLALGETDPDTGASCGSEATVHLTITITDVRAFVADPWHLATVHGWIDAGALGGRLEIHAGWFNLFAPGPVAGTRRMVYRLPVVDGDGTPLTVVGRKEVRNDPGTDILRDTTTLFTRVLDGHRRFPVTADVTVEPHEIAAAGVLRLTPADLARQVATFRTTGPGGPAALARFGRFFLGGLWDVYRPGA